jgi:hypothetical protein
VIAESAKHLLNSLLAPITASEERLEDKVIAERYIEDAAHLAALIIAVAEVMRAS